MALPLAISYNGMNYYSHSLHMQRRDILLVNQHQLAAAAQIMKNDVTPAHIIINDVYAAVGATFLSFLSPRDIFALSLTTHYANGVVTENLFNILRLQQQRRKRLSPSSSTTPDINVAGGSDASVEILYKHSFTEREKLVECLLDKIRNSNLRYSLPGRLTSTETLDETLTCVREDASDVNKWMENHTGFEWYGTFRYDPNEIWKDPTRFSVGCRLSEDEQRGCSRGCWIDYMLKAKMDITNCSDDTLLYRDWARYIIAQKGVVGREWQWKCDGVESVGFMIYKPLPNNEDEDEERDENDLEKAIKALEEEIQGDEEKKDDEQSRSGRLQIEIRFTKRIQQTKPAGTLQPPSLLSELGLWG